MKVLSVILLLSLTASYDCCRLFSKSRDKKELERRQLPLKTMKEPELRASIDSSFTSIIPALEKRIADYEKANLTLLANLLKSNVPFIIGEKAVMEKMLNKTTDTKEREDILLSLAEFLVKVNWDEEWRAGHPYNLSEKCDKPSLILNGKFDAALLKLIAFLDAAKLQALSKNKFWKQFVSDVKTFYSNAYTKVKIEANKLNEPIIKCRTLSLFAKDIEKILLWIYK